MDIVVMLRDPYQRSGIGNSLHSEAADEIETLRSALSEAEKERDAIDARMRELCAAWLKRAERAEAERYALAMAICGGEDAPGYLDSVSVEAIVGVHKKNCQWQIGRAEKAEAELAQARKALEPFAKAANRYDPPEDDDNDTPWGGNNLSIGDLRNARALITDTGRTDGEQK